MTTSMPLMPAAIRGTGSAGTTSTRPSTDDRAPAFAAALDDALTDRAPSRPSEHAADRATERTATRADRAAARAADHATRAAEHAARAADHAARRADRAADRRPDPAGDDDAADPSTPAEDAPQATATATAPPVVLPPGLWALLAAATPPVPEAGTATATAAIGSGPVTAATDPAALPALAAPAAPPPTAVEIPVTGPAVAPGPLPAAPLPATPLPATPLPATPTPAVALPAAAQALAAAVGLTVVVDQGPTADAPAAAPSAAPAADRPAAPVVTDVPVLLPTAGSEDTPDTGADSSAGDPTATAAPTPDAAPPVDTDTVFSLSGPAPAAPPAPGSPTAAPAAPAGADAPVAAQLGRQIAVLRNAPDGSQTMTVVITPDDLGPVTVAVTVTDGKLDLTLHGASEAGRHALREALPELRRELESAGLTFDRLELDTTSRDGRADLRSSQQQLDARAGQQGGSDQPGRQDSRPRAWGSSPDRLGEGPAALTTDQSASSGVDVRV